MKKISIMVALALVSMGGALSAEPQPRMKAALAALQTAKAELQAATADKGGHRVRAIKLVDEAIEQVQKGIAADNAK